MDNINTADPYKDYTSKGAVGIDNLWYPINKPDPLVQPNTNHELEEKVRKWKETMEQTLQKDVDKSLRYNDGKPQWSLVHLKSLEPLVRVLEYGAKKYERDNWKKGLDPQEILDSIIRHVAGLQNGEDRDKESGELHIGHILANCMFYVYHKYSNNGGDTGDRISE